MTVKFDKKIVAQARAQATKLDRIGADRTSPETKKGRALLKDLKGMKGATTAEKTALSKALNRLAEAVASANNTVTVQAVPVGAGTAPIVRRDADEPDAKTSARQLIASASLTGEHDRDLLTAVRMLRNEVQWNPEDKELWTLGVAAFDKNNSLRGGPQASTWTPGPADQAAVARAEQLRTSGDRTGAIRVYRALVKDNCEHEAFWRAGLAVFG